MSQIEWIRNLRPFQIARIAMLLTAFFFGSAPWLLAETTRDVELEISLELLAESSGGSAYWKVIALPDRQDILRQVPEGTPPSSFVSRFADWLDPEIIKDDELKDGKIKKGINYSAFRDELDIFLSRESPASYSTEGMEIFDPAPSQIGEKKTKTFKIKYALKLIRELRLVLATAGMKTGNQHWIEIVPCPHLRPEVAGGLEGPISLATSLQNYNLGLTTEQNQWVREWKDKMACWVGTAHRDVQDLAQRSGLESAAAKVYLTDQLKQLGALLLAHLVGNEGPMPGAVYGGNQSTLQQIVTASAMVIGDYVRVRPVKLQADGSLTIVIEDFKLPKAVSIEVTGEDKTALEAALNARYVDHNRPLEPQKLLTNPFDYPFQAAQQADRDYVKRDPRVLHALWDKRPKSAGENAGVPLVLQATPPQQLIRQLTLSAGFEYTPERALTGALEADFSKMTQSFEQLSLRIEGGTKSFTGQGKMVVPFNDNVNNRLRGPKLSLQAKNDSRDTYRFGNVTRGDVSGTDAVADIDLAWVYNTMTHRQRFEVERALLLTRNRWFQAGSFGGGLRVRDFSFDNDSNGTSGLDQDLSITPYLNWHGTLFFDGSRAVGKRWLQGVLIDSRMDFSFGTKALGSDFDYVKAVASLGAGVEFTDRWLRAFYIEHRWAGGWTDSGTPTFEYLGSGERGFVRGLEQDEFIGRAYVAARTEAGVGVMWLYDQIAGSHGDTGQGSAGEENPLSHLFLALFADFGWLSDQIVDGTDVSATRDLQGYGAQIKMMNFAVGNFPASFAFGYAYSPQSYLNESGFAFSEVSISF